MGKSVAETKSKAKAQESSSDESSAVEESSAEEESDVEVKSESDASSSDEEEQEVDDMETDSSKKRSHDETKEEEVEEEEERPKKTVKVEKPKEKKTFGAEGNTIWVGQINFDATLDDIRNHFSQCGEILDVRLRTEPQTGRSRGFAHIDFKTEEGKQAALKLNATEFMNRTLKVDNGKPATPRTVDNNFGPKTNTVFVANLAHSLDEDGVREVFEKFGTITGDIRLPWNRETGKIRGIGYIQFETEDEAEAAVKGMNGVVVEGRPLRTDFSGGDDSERVNNRPARGGFGGRGRGGRGGRGGNRGRGGPRGGSRGGRGRGGRQ